MDHRFTRRALLGSAAAVWGLAATAHAGDARPAGPPPSIALLAQGAQADHVCLSPDGTRAAYVAARGNMKILVIQEIASDKVTKFDIGDVKVMDLIWLDNSHLGLRQHFTENASYRRYGKYETAAGVIIDVETKKVNPLFGGGNDYESYVGRPLSRIKTANGYQAATIGMIYVNSNYHEQLCRFDLPTARATMVDDGGADSPDWAFGLDGHPTVRSQYDEQTHLFTVSFNRNPPGEAKIWKTAYSATETLDRSSLEGIGRDGKSAVVFINKPEGGAYFELSPDGTLSAPLAGAHDGDVNALYHPATRRLVGFAYEQDWPAADYFDPLLKTLYASLAEALPGYRFTIIDFAEDPRKLIFYGESADDAGGYFHIDFTTGAVKPLAERNAGLPEEWLTEKKKITYKAADGLEIVAYLTLPPFKGTTNLPLVVLPHGGPQAHDTLAFDWQVQALATRGYAVLQPNFRGSSGYGKAFVAAGHGEFGRKMQTDLSDGVAHLVKQGTVDARRVCIVGASYGGYAALAGVSLQTGIYNCAASIAGISDPKGMLVFEDTQTDSHDPLSVRYLKRYMGDETRLDEISPMKHAGNVGVPVLLLHGTDDSVVPIDQSQKMEKALKAAGKPVEFVTYTGQDHWETQGASRTAMMTAVLAFLAKNNPA